jgi:phage-related protein
VTKPWVVEFYEGEAEGCPVREFLLALDKPQRAKLVALIRLLEEQGPLLPFPYSRQIRGKLRELRTQYGKNYYRVLYFGGPGRTFVVLHAFTKRAPVTPEGEIALAERRMVAYLEGRRGPAKGGNRHEA